MADVSSSQRVARNLGWSTIGQVSTWILSLCLVVYLPRRVGPAAVGTLYFSQALWAVAGAVATFGTDQLVTKQVANSELDGREAARRSVAVRILLLFMVWPIVLGGLLVGGYSGGTLKVCLAIGLASSLTVLGTSWRDVLVGAELLARVNLIEVLGKALLLVVVVAVASKSDSMAVVAWAWVLPALVGGVLFRQSTRSINRVASTSAVSPFSRGSVTETLNLGRPFLLLSGSVLLYHQIDVLVISQLANDTAVGWYGAADQLYTSAFFVTTILFGTVGAILFRLDARRDEAGRNALNDGAAIVLAFAVGSGLGIASVGDDLTVLVFGEKFASAGPVLQVLGLALIPAYTATYLGFVALTSGLALVWARMMLVATVVTVLLDVVLVPYMDRRFDNGALGGSWSYVITETVIVGAGMRILRDVLDARELGKSALRQAGAGLLMFLTLDLVEAGPLAARITLGAVVFVAAMTLLRGLTQRQRTLITNALPAYPLAGAGRTQQGEGENADK